MNLRRSALFALVLGVSLVALTSCGKSSRVASPDTALDPAPPAAPTALHSVYADGPGYDYLMWTKSSSASVTGYEIYQSTTLGGTPVYVTTVGASLNNVILPNVEADCTMYYQVRARAGSNVSSYSAALAVVRHAVVTAASGGSPSGGTINRIAD